MSVYEVTSEPLRDDVDDEFFSRYDDDGFSTFTRAESEDEAIRKARKRLTALWRKRGYGHRLHFVADRVADTMGEAYQVRLYGEVLR